MLDVVTSRYDSRFASARHSRARVTVAVSLFNYGSVILETLESVLTQDLGDLDLVVVDDCSTDGGDMKVLAWMQRHADRFGRCSLLRHTENQELARTRNQGFAWASTDYVFVLDADNHLYPRCISVCLTAADVSHADAVTTIIEVFGEEQGVLGTDPLDPALIQLGNYVDAMALIRRDAWRHIGGYRRMPLSGWEDFDFWLKCVEQSLQVAHVPEILCRYRKSSSSMLSTLMRSGAHEALWEDIRLHHPAALPSVGRRSLTISSRRSPDVVRVDSRTILSGTGEVRAFMVVRNELPRLRSSLEHHRGLGVDRFFVIDNGSRDGTEEFLLTQADVHVFRTDAAYQEARLGIDWLERLLHDYGADRWCLVLDADEHLVYPQCESVGVAQLGTALEQRGLECLLTMFVDMYSDRPIAETRLQEGRMPLDACPFFDPAGYYRVPSHSSRLPRWYGGPRARLFFPDVDRFLLTLAEKAFDEAAYLSEHIDVREAVERGLFNSGLQHFQLHGHQEERHVILRQLGEWPEAAYLRAHPDVRDAVERGVFRDGLEHFVWHGQFEPMRLGRGTASPWLSQVPLLRWRSGLRLSVGRHQVDGATWRRRDAVGGALLHFRLMADLAERATAAVDASAEAVEPSWAIENERYRYVLQLNPGLCARTPDSVRYRDSTQLCELGLVALVDAL